MALSDPILLPNPDGTDATDLALSRINSNTGGLYATPDGMIQFSVRNDRTSSSTVGRYSVVMTYKRIVADALVPTTNKLLTSRYTFTIQAPLSGSTAATEVSMARRMIQTLIVSSGARLTKIVQGEV